MVDKIRTFAVLDDTNKIIARDLLNRERAEAVMAAATARNKTGLRIVEVETDPTDLRKPMTSEELDRLGSGRDQID